jgi:hypothetical protein
MDNNECPRCLGLIPSNDNPGAYVGARSRIDNSTEICSACGTEEALVLLADTANWPVFLYGFDADLTSAAKDRALSRWEVAR